MISALSAPCALEYLQLLRHAASVSQMPHQHESTRMQAILGKYLGECQAIKNAVTAAKTAKESAEDRYANARTQQQAEAAEADITSAIEALAQVPLCGIHCGSESLETSRIDGSGRAEVLSLAQRHQLQQLRLAASVLSSKMSDLAHASS